MSDFQAIADRVEIEALRGEFTDAASATSSMTAPASPAHRSVTDSNGAAIWPLGPAGAGPVHILVWIRPGNRPARAACACPQIAVREFGAAR